MPARIDITGQRFGRLVVLEYVGNKNWRIKCDCGNENIVIGQSLRRGLTTSCGCYGREALNKNRPSHVKHGQASRGRKTSIYQRWNAMRKRCYNQNAPFYADYGGRGIKVCDRWRDSFEEFYADVGDPPLGMSLDRWPNNDGDYEPGNVRWATPLQQRHNRRR